MLRRRRHGIDRRCYLPFPRKPTSLGFARSIGASHLGNRYKKGRGLAVSPSGHDRPYRARREDVHSRPDRRPIVYRTVLCSNHPAVFVPLYIKNAGLHRANLKKYKILKNRTNSAGRFC